MLNNLIKDTARLAIYMQNKGKPINKTDIKDKGGYRSIVAPKCRLLTEVATTSVEGPWQGYGVRDRESERAA